MNERARLFGNQSLELIAPEAQVFEERRQHLETKNEIVITGIIGVSCVLGLIPNGLQYLSPDRASDYPGLLLLLLLCVCIAVSVWLIRYLSRDPPYVESRKYIMTAFGVSMNFIAMVFLQGNDKVPVAAVSFIPIAGYVLMVVLSGLRFDVKVVALAGVIAYLAHLLFLCLVLPSGPYTVPSAVFSLLVILAATACVMFMVSSILRLHRESVFKERLARFLAPEVVNEISRKPEMLRRNAEKRIASILFADIRGFTALSEEYPPEEVGEILNLFLEEMTTSIMDNRGMVDKYIGDSIMGVFGVPVASEDHALQAIQAGLEMQQRLRRVNATMAEEGKSPLAIGIGIHTGEVVAGAIGSSRRLEYTVIGDTVNVASRVEALTKEHSRVILVSQQTRDLVARKIPLEKVTTTQLRGRKQEVVLWSPVLSGES